MEMECRPGSPLVINLGGSYAQPAVSFEAIPGGNELSRTESYLGNRNCGAPWTSEEERQAEKIAEAGRGATLRQAELLLLAREYAIRDNAAKTFIQGSTFA